MCRVFNKHAAGKHDGAIYIGRGSYSGVNVLILWGAVVERGFAGQSWLTFRQALSLGGSVRKGEHGTTVVYADRFIPDENASGRSATVTSPARSRSSNDSQCSTPISARAFPTD